jgi:large subunit ribosomal protein L18
MHTHKRTSARTAARIRRKERVRKNVRGTAEKPRLSVYRSAKHVFVQLVDDDKGVTLVSASTQEKEFSGKEDSSNCKGAKAVGKLLAERAKVKSISQVCFDRAGYLFHGRVKAVAEGAREAGLKF